MRHVAHQQRADLVGDLAEGREVPQPRIGGGAGHDHLRPVLPGQRAHLVHVDQGRLAVHVVRDEVVVLPAEVHRRAVREVAALVEAQSQHGVATLQERVVDGHVRLRAGVGLDVHVLRAEQLLRAVAGEVLDDVHDLAATVVAAARVSLGVLRGEDGAHGLDHRKARIALRRDELEVRPRPLLLVTHELRDLGILGLQRRPHVHGPHLRPMPGLLRCRHSPLEQRRDDASTPRSSSSTPRPCSSSSSRTAPRWRSPSA